MHYYKFNIADYRKDTVHLSPIEHYIYRELIDWAYLDECAIPDDLELIQRRLRLSGDQGTLVEQVLNEFWFLFDDGWHHPRVDADIQDFEHLIKQRSKAGKKSAASRKKRAANKRSTRVQHNSTKGQLPITHNPETNTQSKGRFAPPSQDDVFAYCHENGHEIDAQAFVDFYQSKNWMVGKNKMKDWKAAVRNWVRRDHADRKKGSTRDQSMAEVLGDTSWAK